jgi:TPR repeat protein
VTEQAYPDALPAQYRLHWYVLERVLGQGGFGITYLARDANLDQPVAIKEYLPIEVATRRPDATIRSRTDEQRDRYRWGLERFIQEARTLARFDHPNIVRVHSVFEANNTAYMVMRFEQGQNLAAMLDRRGTLPERELLGIMLPILDGLQLVHDAGFIHRDIKPDNIHIRADGTPVLLDFGSARHALGRADTLTILVAPGYAPFEQYYSDAESQGPWTDLYGLAATCYRAIAGRAPLDAIARSKGILGSTRDVLVPASVVGAGRYSGGFLAAVDHALAFSEKDRPQSIVEWRRELTAEGVAPATRLRAANGATGAASEVLATAATAEAAAPPEPARARRGLFISLGPVKGGIFWGVAGAAAAAALTAAYLPRPKPERVATADAALEETRRKLEAIEARIREKEAADAAREVHARAQAEQAKRDEEQRAKEETARREAEAVRKRDAEPGRKRDAEPARKPEPPRRTDPSPAPPAAVASPAAPPPAAVPAAPPEPARPQTVAERLAAADAASDRGDYAAAVAILQPLADANETGALVRLATLHRRGLGVPRSDTEALRLLQAAAERGHTGAMVTLADFVSTGRGTPRDDAAALTWYRRAADRGSGEAASTLGDWYLEGRAVTRSPFQAYVWYGHAARAGNARGPQGQQQVATQLQPAEREQADALIANRPATRE